MALQAKVNAAFCVVSPFFGNTALGKTFLAGIMLRHREVKLGLATFLVAAAWSVIDALGTQPTPANYVGPIMVGVVAAFGSYVFIRKPMEHFLAAKGKADPPPSNSSEFAYLDKLIDETTEVRLASLRDSLNAARTDIAGYVAKELDQKLTSQIDEQIQSLSTTSSILDCVVRNIRSDLSDFVTAGAAITEEPGKGQLTTACSSGLEERGLKNLLAVCQRAIVSIVTSQEAVVWDLSEINAIAGLPVETANIVVLPLRHADRFLGCLVICLNSHAEALPRTLKALMKLNEHIAHIVYRVAVVEDLERVRLHDRLTQTLNRTALNESIAQYAKSVSPNKPNLCLLLIEGINFAALNDKFGRDRADLLIVALAETLTRNLRGSRLSSSLECLHRTGAAQFAVIFENIDEQRMHKIAERIVSSVAIRKVWPEGLTEWSVAIAGVTSADVEKLDDLMSVGEDIHAYLREQPLESNRILFASNLPARFRRIKHHDAGMSGSVDLLDPAPTDTSVTGSHGDDAKTS